MKFANTNERSKMSNSKKAFTIVELLVVIVVIGILAAITIVSYNGINNRAIAVTLISDLDNDAKLLKLYNVDHGFFPATIGVNYCPNSPEADPRYCLKASTGNELTYSGSGQTFTLTDTHTSTGVTYTITESSGATLATNNGGGGSSANAQIFDGSPSCGLSDDGNLSCWIHDSDWNGSNEPAAVTGSSVPSVISEPAALNGLTIKTMATTYGSTCAIASNDQTYCWGQNSNGELANEDYTSDPSTVPTSIHTDGDMNGKTFKSLSGGMGEMCGIANDNNAYCWGTNGNGELGAGSSNYTSFIPVAVNKSGVLSGKTIKTLSVGSNQSVCAIASDNLAYCWGDNLYYGKLGNNSLTSSNSPVQVYTGGLLNSKTIKMIATGGDHACAVASDEKIYCWGINRSGQLGTGSTSYNSSVPAATVMTGALNGKTISSINASFNYTCVIASDSKVYCWGMNGSGQLGNGTTTDSSSPVRAGSSGAMSGKSISELALGSGAACALSTDSQLYCWGTNYSGQFGNGTTSDSSTPVLVNYTGALSGKTVKHIYSLGNHVCAIGSDNNAYCWGDGDKGSLGNNSSGVSLIPQKVTTSNPLAGETIKSASVFNDNTYEAICVLTNSEKMFCWGRVRNNYSIPFGDFSTIATLPREVPMTGALSGKTVKKLPSTIGTTNSCLIASDDKVYCWGRNISGGIGNGLSGDDTYSSPVAVDATGAMNGKTMTKVAAGSDFACALDSAGAVYCWGANYVGMLGNGGVEDYDVSPVSVVMNGALNGKTVKDLAVGMGHVCVIASDNKPYCWGYGAYGQLGDNKTDLADYLSRVPIAVDMTGVLNGKTVKMITTGDIHSCVIASDDKPYCWGDNMNYEIGNKSSTSLFAAPTAVYADGEFNGKSVIKISSSTTHTCAIASDGGNYCWGMSSKAG